MYLYTRSTSDLGQESYVISMLKEKKNGYYVELGSGDPIQGNNTHMLEEALGWTGLAIDIDEKLADRYNKERKNKCVATDALTFDYTKYFEDHNYPTVIDYLQIDIDGHEEGRCLLALLALPMLKYKFRIITIEHDLCRNFKWQGMRDAQREILHTLGYSLTGQLDGEDWWVYEKELPLDGEQIDLHFRNAHVIGEKDI